MKDDLLIALQKKYGRVIRYESIYTGKEGTYYFFNLEIFTKPMFVFHILRHIAISLDKMANFTRKIIRNNTIKKENLEFHFKEK